MSEWQPIDTAPVGVNVEVGGWDAFRGEYTWHTSSGIVFKRRFFGLFKSREYVGCHHTHWRPLPPPPSPAQPDGHPTTPTEGQTA